MLYKENQVRTCLGNIAISKAFLITSKLRKNQINAIRLAGVFCCRNTAATKLNTVFSISSRQRRVGFVGLYGIGCINISHLRRAFSLVTSEVKSRYILCVRGGTEICANHRFLLNMQQDRCSKGPKFGIFNG
jgi:hypothetical protein